MTLSRSGRRRLRSAFLLAAAFSLVGLPAAAQQPSHGGLPAGGSRTADSRVAPTASPSAAELRPALDQRIITLAPSQTEIVYALGLEEQLVGWTQYDDYPPEVRESDGWVPYDEYVFTSVADELAKERAVVGGFTSFNYDVIDALDPTLILAAEPLQQQVVDELAARGYNVMWWAPSTLDDVHQMIIEIGEAVGGSAAATAHRLVRDQQRQIAEIRAVTAGLPKPRVYVEISHYGPWALGSGSPMDDIIEIAGGENLFNDVDSIAFPADNAEIAARNPDVILSPMWIGAGSDEVTTIFEISSRPGYSETDAVQTDRVYHYDSSMLKRPGPRQVTAILKLAHLLHPYYFDNPEDSVSPWELGRIDELYPPPVPLD
jgi:iron complex transport system substrate-binding protein